MSEEARANGWRGFDGVGERVAGGWWYHCDGMPTLMGCGAEVVVPRRWARVGKKKSGWLVTYGLEPNEPDSDLTDYSQLHEDKDVVLTYCPRCVAIVEEQMTELRKQKAT